MGHIRYSSAKLRVPGLEWYSFGARLEESVGCVFCLGFKKNLNLLDSVGVQLGNFGFFLERGGVHCG